MVNEQRISRIEDKLDNVRTDIATIKTKMDAHMIKIEDHIAGDKKIISDWLPVVQLVPELKEIIDNHKYEKKAAEKRNKFLVTTATVIGILTGIAKLFGLI